MKFFSAPSPIQEFFKKWREMFFVFWVSIIAWISATVLKIIIAAERPFISLPDVISLFEKTDASFPSGHATFFGALAMAIFFKHKKAGLVFMLFAFIIGLARVAAGVHFPIDILGGFALGAGIAYLLKKI